MICRLIGRANNGLFHAITDTLEVVRLYNANDTLRIGDFIYTSEIKYDYQRDDAFVLFCQPCDALAAPLSFRAKKYATPCAKCQNRLRHLTTGCKSCLPKKIEK